MMLVYCKIVYCNNIGFLFKQNTSDIIIFKCFSCIIIVFQLVSMSYTITTLYYIFNKHGM